jgi:hypothetical protein
MVRVEQLGVFCRALVGIAPKDSRCSRNLPISRVITQDAFSKERGPPICAVEDPAQEQQAAASGAVGACKPAGITDNCSPLVPLQGRKSSGRMGELTFLVVTFPLSSNVVSLHARLHHLCRLAEKNPFSLLGNCRATGVWLALCGGALARCVEPAAKIGEGVEILLLAFPRGRSTDRRRCRQSCRCRPR